MIVSSILVGIYFLFAHNNMYDVSTIVDVGWCMDIAGD